MNMYNYLTYYIFQKKNQQCMKNSEGGHFLIYNKYNSLEEKSKQKSTLKSSSKAYRLKE